MHEEDQDSLFGSPPPSPRFSTAASASIYDNERRLSTSTDTQNVGTIALPGSHNSELPLNPLALSLNQTTVHRPPAQSQDQPTTANINFQPCRPPTAQNNGNGNRRSSRSPSSNVPFRDPDFSLPDPAAPPPAHFLRNQQNLLGKAGLVAGVKPSTITHIRGTSFNPIVIDDEDTPILGRQSRDPGQHYIDPSLLTAPTNEDIVSVLIAQKDIFPVLNGILGFIGKKATQPTPTTSLPSRYDFSNPPPIKKRKLHRVPAGAADWDVPYPFQEGDGPDEYHKTWECKRAKDLVVQLVKLIKLAARKAAIKNHLRKETRQAIWEDLIKPSNTAAVPDDVDALISSILNSLPQDQGIGTTPVPSSSSSSRQPSLIGDDAIDPALLALSAVQSGPDENFSGQITGDFWSGMTEEGNMTPMVGEEGKGNGKEVLRTDPLGFSSADATIPTQSPPHDTFLESQLTDIVLPLSYEQQPEYPTPAPASASPAPRPKYNISQSRKEEILKRAREKRKQVQEELDRVKTQLWETTIEQAALVHLLKHYENDQDGGNS